MNKPLLHQTKLVTASIVQGQFKRKQFQAKSFNNAAELFAGTIAKTILKLSDKIFILGKKKN